MFCFIQTTVLSFRSCLQREIALPPNQYSDKTVGDTIGLAGRARPISLREISFRRYACPGHPVFSGRCGHRPLLYVIQTTVLSFRSCLQRGIAHPPNQYSDKIVGEAFRLPQADNIRPYAVCAPHKLSYCHPEDIVRRIFALTHSQKQKFYITSEQRFLALLGMTILCFCCHSVIQ